MGETSSGRGLNGNNIASIVAVLISVSALAVSILDTSSQRAESRAAVWPHLTVDVRYDSEGFRLEVQNDGVGPARVRWSKMLLDGEEIADLDAAILATLGPEEAFSYDVYQAGGLEQAVLASGDWHQYFFVPWEDRTRRLVNNWEGRVTIETCYCSVYDDCWIARLREGDPEPVTQCPARD